MPRQQLKNELPYNRTVLRWARQWRNRTLEEAAARVGTSAAKVAAWEEGSAKPTVRQARRLADYYDRPFLEFFLPEPPEVKDPPQLYDYRLYSGEEALNDQDVLPIVRWVDEMRQNALGLYELLEEAPPSFPTDLLASEDADPEEKAGQLRAAVNFSVEEQISLPVAKRHELPRLLRKAVEDLGVLVLRRNELTKLGVRGICVYDQSLPVIVFGKEAPTAQTFTIAHELGHVLWQDNSISGMQASERFADTSTREAWCNRFAAAFLMPHEHIAVYLPAERVSRAGIEDVDLNRMARLFSVSPHSMLIRLVQLDYIAPEYYWDVKRPEFLKEEKEQSDRFGGIAPYYGVRYRSQAGDTYTGLVIAALEAGHITNHTAAQFMGIKNLTHLNDVVENFHQ